MLLAPLPFFLGWQSPAVLDEISRLGGPSLSAAAAVCAYSKPRDIQSGRKYPEEYEDARRPDERSHHLVVCHRCKHEGRLYPADYIERFGEACRRSTCVGTYVARSVATLRRTSMRRGLAPRLATAF